MKVSKNQNQDNVISVFMVYEPLVVTEFTLGKVRVMVDFMMASLSDPLPGHTR